MPTDTAATAMEVGTLLVEMGLFLPIIKLSLTNPVLVSSNLLK